MSEVSVDDGVSRDVVCVDCGYDLRGTDPEGMCPECGYPVSESCIRLKYIGNIQWAKRIAFGARLMRWGVIACGLVILYILISFMVGIQSEYGFALLGCVFGLMIVLFNVGSWILATQKSWENNALEKTVRICVLLWICLVGAILLGFVGDIDILALIATFVILLWLVTAVWVFCVAKVIANIHERIVFHSVSECGFYVENLAWVLVGTIVLGPIFSVVTMGAALCCALPFGMLIVIIICICAYMALWEIQKEITICLNQ